MENSSERASKGKKRYCTTFVHGTHSYIRALGPCERKRKKERKNLERLKLRTLTRRKKRNEERQRERERQEPVSKPTKCQI